jgi:hypothetical protein
MATLDDVLLGATIIASLIFVPWVFFIRPWLRRRQASANDRMPVVNLAEQRAPAERWSMRGELARLFLVEDRAAVMSSDRAEDSSSPIAAGQARHQEAAPVPVSAEPNTDDAGQVPGASALDTSARDIMRASVIAELLDSGLLTNRDKAICQVFRCSKASSNRPDAPFQVALRLVEQHRAKRRPEYVGDMIARVEREVAEQH